MSQTIAIGIHNLGKRYSVDLSALKSDYRTIRESIVNAALAPIRRIRHGGRSGNFREFWALKDIDLEIPEGEVVGIIGHNGAGKSTLLKLISEITAPTTGEIRIRGRIGSLLEVGTGFHPELTGRENVFLNGAILGMPRREIARKFDSIVEFSEVGQFIDMPVKRYSSGMYVRLAFAVAAHMEPDILLLDEVLAVGDSSFQRKCTQRMEDLKRDGRTILFISHSMSAIRSMCTKVAVLQKGQLVGWGDTAQQVSDYLARLALEVKNDLADRVDREGNGRARVTDIRFLDGDGNHLEQAYCGDMLKVIVRYQTDSPGPEAKVALSFWTTEGIKAFHVDNIQTGESLHLQSKEGEFTCEFPRLALTPGKYYINVLLSVGGTTADHVMSASAIDVLHGDFFRTGRTTADSGGVVFAEHSWK